MNKSQKKVVSSLKKRKATNTKGPLWKGPEVDGISQSLLSVFIQCRERFRLLVVEGFKTADTFNHRIEYGNLWHACEEACAKGEDWEAVLRKNTEGLIGRYKYQQEQVVKWHNVCLVQFPIYVDYWTKQKDVREGKPVCQEQVFRSDYGLPSGRTVILRGKWDLVDIVGNGKNARTWLQENKTKGDIKEDQLRKQLQFDLQTMIYLTALGQHISSCWIDSDLSGIITPTIGGVRYNVIRRPLSGGRHSISQYKPTKTRPSGESQPEFYARLQGLIKEDPGFFFMRWKVSITKQDLLLFENTFLTPVLEELCTWWDWIAADPFNPWRENNKIHYRTPYGIYNVLAEGGATDLDEHLATGSTTGLQRATSLFGELE